MINGELLMNGTPSPPPSGAKDGRRPESFAQALDSIAAWMDRAERTLVRRGEIGKRSSGRVQADLRRAARALREDPVLDSLMLDAMEHGPETEDPAHD